jgi:hypothetical protein
VGWRPRTRTPPPAAPVILSPTVGFCLPLATVHGVEVLQERRQMARQIAIGCISSLLEGIRRSQQGRERETGSLWCCLKEWAVREAHVQAPSLRCQGRRRQPSCHLEELKEEGWRRVLRLRLPQPSAPNHAPRCQDLTAATATKRREGE